MKNFVWVLGGLVLLTTACRKAADPVMNTMNTTTPDTSRALQLRFQSVVNGASLQLDSVWYRNAAGDSFQVTNHQYYVSNFALETESGETVALPESYFLINARNPQTRIISGIPAGTYQKISFLLGVDSARNVSGAQTDDLSQGAGMFWDWNAGYIMAKLEGALPQGQVPGNFFSYHIVGFSGRSSVLRRVNLSLTSPLKVEDGKRPTVFIQSDVGSWFSGTTTFSLRDLYSIAQPGKDAASVASNYANGFSVVRIDP